MLHRLRYAYDHPQFKKSLTNIVEIDETHTNGDARNKHENKKLKNFSGNTIREATSVLGMLQRDGHIIAKVVPNRQAKMLLPLIMEHVEPMAFVMTDELKAYKSLKKRFYHNTVNHSAKQYVNGMIHTQGIENFWSHLKRGIDGIYHWASVKHLQAYVDEFAIRYNTRTFDTQSRFDLLLSNTSEKRLTYDNLIQKA